MIDTSNSPALQRFDQLLVNQQQFNDFLIKGNSHLTHSIEAFEMHHIRPQTTDPTGIQEGRDFTVRQLGNGPYPWHWQGLGTFSNWESDRGSLSQQEACMQAQQELATLNLPELDYTPTANRDFLVYPLYGLFYWKSYGDVFGEDEYQSANGHSTPSAAEANAIAALSALDIETADSTVATPGPARDYRQLIPIPDICPFALENDFVLEQADDGRWHWEGVTGSQAEDYCSEDGFESERYAVADAIYQLSLLVSGCDHADALTRVYEQALPIHHLQEPQA